MTLAWRFLPAGASGYACGWPRVWLVACVCAVSLPGDLGRGAVHTWMSSEGCDALMTAPVCIIISLMSEPPGATMWGGEHAQGRAGEQS